MRYEPEAEEDLTEEELNALYKEKQEQEQDWVYYILGV